MSDTYKAVFTGKLLLNTKAETAIKALVAGFGLSDKQAAGLVNAKRPVVVKKGINQQQCQALCKRLNQIGLQAQVVAEGTAPTAKAAGSPPPPPGKTAPAETAQPKQAAQTPPAAPPENPYATPEADLTPAVSSVTHINEPRKVEARQGYRWLVSAFAMLKQHPWAWMGAVAAMYAIIGVVSIVPLIGSFAGYFLGPIFSGGLMIGAHEQEEGGDFRFEHLWAGFNANRNQLLLLGAFSLVGFLVCLIPVILFAGFSLFTGNFNPESMGAGTIVMVMIGMLLSMTLTVPLYMAIWFAPNLVAVEKEDAWPALKLSFQATRKNMLPFLVYGLTIMGSFSVFGIAAAILIPLLISSGSQILALLVFIPFLIGMFLIVPIGATIAISMYTGYRDIFYE
jgi:hypothetical protein